MLTDSDDILKQFLDAREKKEFLKAKKAFDDKDYSLCQRICDNIVHNIDSDSRRSYELLLESRFSLQSIRNDCIYGALNNEPEEEIIEKIFEKFIAREGDYIKNYLSEFNDSEAKSFILQFKDRIINTYKEIYSSRVPVEQFLNSTLSKRKILYFRCSAIDGELCFWKVGDFYCTTDNILGNSDDNIYIKVFKDLSSKLYNIEYKMITMHYEKFWAYGKYRDAFTPVYNAPLPEHRKLSMYSSTIYNYICVNNYIYELKERDLYNDYEERYKLFLSRIAKELKRDKYNKD